MADEPTYTTEPRGAPAYTTEPRSAPAFTTEPRQDIDPPRPFINRIMRGDAFMRAIGPLTAPVAGAARALGEGPIGMTDETANKWRDQGIFPHGEAGRPGLLIQHINEAAIRSLAFLGDAAFKSVVGAAGGMARQFAEDAGSSEPDSAEREARALTEWRMIRGDHARLEPGERGPIARNLGPAAIAEDILNAAKRLAPDVDADHLNLIQMRLRDLWYQRGILPSEAAFDASRDPFFHRMLTEPYGRGVDIPDASGIRAPVGSPVPEGAPRSALAKTGHPVIDSMLENPDTKRGIDSPVIRREAEVPGGAKADPTGPGLRVDVRTPEVLTIDGVTFNPAEPLAVRSFVERDTLGMLEGAKMSAEDAGRIATTMAESAEDAWYQSHGIDSVKAREAIHIEPPVEAPKATPAELKKAEAIIEAAEPERALQPAGAQVTPPAQIPGAPPPAPAPPGRLIAAGRSAVSNLLGLARNIQGWADPMATGSKHAMVTAKDTVNVVRRIRFEHLMQDRAAVKRFKLEQLERMWNAADEESVALQENKARLGLAEGPPAPVSPHMGLATLTPEERAFVEAAHADAQSAWLAARDAGMVDSEGLPAYTPRMVVNVAGAVEHVGPRALNEMGRNVFTRTSQMLHRRYLLAEETEQAAKDVLEKRMTEAGATPAEIAEATGKVAVVRNIRTLLMATARLKEAVIWKSMIDEIEAVGKAAGQNIVATSSPGRGWFTIPGNPAFARWGPISEKNPVTGKWGIKMLDTGEPAMERKPIWMPDEWRGPMMAILEPGPAAIKAGHPTPYGAAMALKSKSMSLILNSPLIHNAVVWSKVAEAAGFRNYLGVGLYFRGRRLLDTPRASELIERGLNPMGPHGYIQDISGMMAEPGYKIGQSWTAKVAAAVPGLFDARAETAVMKTIDKAGDFWHNELLWNRVRDAQFGLADHLSDHLVARGVDRYTADVVGSHFSNVIVGSIPKEAMSQAAAATANLLLFSRSFTLGNLSTYKIATLGLPAPLLAQIEAHGGLVAGTPGAAAVAKTAAQIAQGIARRKALATIVLSTGLYYIGNALMQHAMNVASAPGNFQDVDAWKDALAQEVQGYARRYKDQMEAVQKDPWEIRHLISGLSPTADNEPKKGDRFHIGYTSDGTAIYGRNPTGKFGEEILGYPSMPLEMLRRKASPIAGAFLDLIENDRGFGRKIYDDADTSMSTNVANIIAVGKHIVMRHLPEQQIEGAIDWYRGRGDETVNKYRTIAPMFGFTVSVGTSGGMGKGEVANVRGARDVRFNLHWPEIRKQIQGGDIEGGRAALEGLHIPQGMINSLIFSTQNPSALKGRTMRDFLQSATPEQIERFNRAQGGR